MASTDANGKRTEGTYDALGRLLRVWLPNRPKASNPNSPSVEYAYQISTLGPAANAVTTRKLNAAGNYVVSHSLYDGLMRPRQTQRPGANGGRVITDTLYDSVGRAYKTWGPYHAVGTPDTNVYGPVEWTVTTILETGYDRASRAVTSTLRGGDGISSIAQKSQTATAYGGDRVYVTPADGGTATTTISDIRGNTVELRQHQGGTPAGAYTSTGYSFNRKGQLVAVTDPDGNQSTFTYDVAGRKISADHPDKGTMIYTYNDAGELILTEDARGEKLAYEYDVLGRKKGVYDDVISATTKRATWTYDNLVNATTVKGQLATATRWVGTDAYVTQIRGYTSLYQSLGENYVIPAAEGGLANTYTYIRQYKVDGSPATVAYPAGGGLSVETLTYRYDSVSGLPLGLDTNATGVTSYVTNTQYTEFGQPSIVTYKTGTSKWVERGYTYDTATGQVVEETTMRESAPQMLTDVHYKPDEMGNVKEIWDPTGGSADHQCFRYDHLRRLTTAWTPANGDCAPDPTAGGLGGPAPYWLSWTYDNVGNRRSEVVHAGGGDTTRTYAYPAPGTDRPHAVQSVTTSPGSSTVTYGYNANGDTTSRPGPNGAAETLGWDTEGRLSTLDGGGQQTTFLYDADGGRLLRRDPTGTTLYLPGMELRRAGGVTTATRYYTFGGAVCASRTPSALTWLATDRQGTEQVAVAVTSAQTVTQRRQTPFGGNRGTPVTWPNATGFVGGSTDPASNDTGLVHLSARDYDPNLGRFISVDPVQDLTDPQQWSSYAYANNSPVTFSDASGAMYTDEGGGFGSAPASGPFGMAAYGQYFGAQHGYTGPSPYTWNNAYGDWYSCPGQGATCNNGNGKDPTAVPSKRVVTTTNYNFGVLEEYDDGTFAINGVVLHEGHPDPDQLAHAIDSFIDSTGMYFPTPDELARMPSWMREYWVYKAIVAGCSSHEMIDCVNGGDFLADASVNEQKARKRMVDEMPHGMVGFCLNTWAAAYAQGGISDCVVPGGHGTGLTGSPEVGYGAAFGITSGVSVVYSNRSMQEQTGPFEYCNVTTPIGSFTRATSKDTRTYAVGFGVGPAVGYTCGHSYTFIAPSTVHTITRIPGR